MKRNKNSSPRGEKYLCLFLCIDLNISMAKREFQIKKNWRARTKEKFNNKHKYSTNICIVLSCSITCIFTGRTNPFFSVYRYRSWSTEESAIWALGSLVIGALLGVSSIQVKQQGAGQHTLRQLHHDQALAKAGLLSWRSRMGMCMVIES